MDDTATTDGVAEGLAGQTRLRSMEFRDGKLHLELEPAHEIVSALVASGRTILDGAQNYTELTFEASDCGERYVLTLQRPGRLTPHEARVKAEAERDEARAALALAEQSRDDFRRACQAEAQGGAARLTEARSYRLEWPRTAYALSRPDRDRGVGCKRPAGTDHRGTRTRARNPGSRHHIRPVQLKTSSGSTGLWVTASNGVTSVRIRLAAQHAAIV